MTKIDPINAKILKELLIDGRKRFTEIAKECNTSKDVITKRYKRMKEEGIIVGATIQNSYACCGGNLIVCIHINTQPDEVERILPLVQKLPKVFAVYQLGIRPSLVAIVTLQNIEELSKIKQLITKLHFISGVNTRVWTGLRNTPENLSILSPQETAANIDNLSEKTKKRHKIRASKIDKIDAQIIDILSKNGRMPFKRIAEELNTSTDTIARRYTKLKQDGHIKVVIQINPTKRGYHAYATFNIACISQDDSPDILEALAEIPDISQIIRTSGSFDFMIVAMIKDIEQLTSIREKIIHMTNITNMEIDVANLFSVWPLQREFISTT